MIKLNRARMVEIGAAVLLTATALTMLSLRTWAEDFGDKTNAALLARLTPAAVTAEAR